MAINSRDRRGAAGSDSWDIIYPLADGTVGTADRAQAAGYYPGIAVVPKGRIDGTASFDLEYQHESIIVQSDGSDWWIL